MPQPLSQNLGGCPGASEINLVLEDCGVCGGTDYYPRIKWMKNVRKGRKEEKEGGEGRKGRKGKVQYGTVQCWGAKVFSAMRDSVNSVPESHMMEREN